MNDKKPKVRRCGKCKKEKPESEGYVKLGGMFFCCKQCCGKEDAGAKPNTCEFC